MAKYIYVDYSNLFVTARLVSGSRKRAAGEADLKGGDQAFHINFWRLYGFLAGQRPKDVKRCALFTSRTAKNQEVWQYAEQAGFEVFLFDRNPVGVEKKVDTALVAHMIKDAYTVVDRATDTITLVSSDSDFVPPVELLVKDGYKVEVCSWEWYSADIRAAASKFIRLDGHLDLFQHDQQIVIPAATVGLNSIGAAFNLLDQQEFAWSQE